METRDICLVFVFGANERQHAWACVTERHRPNRLPSLLTRIERSSSKIAIGWLCRKQRPPRSASAWPDSSSVPRNDARTHNLLAGGNPRPQRISALFPSSLIGKLPKLVTDVH